MHSIVCIKQVPGTNKVNMDPDSGTLIRSGAEAKLNPYDLYAVETALRLREQYGGTVRVISMGPPQAEAIIREAYTMGADDGILLSDSGFAGSDVLATSYTLSRGIERMAPFDLILCGKQTTDGDTAQVGPEIAEFLGIPSISAVRRILQADRDSITMEMDLQSDIHILKAGLPCLMSVDKDIFQPRLPSYRRKQETKDRPVQIWSLSDLADQDKDHYGLNGSPTQVIRIFPPESGRRQEIWRDSGEALADALFDRLQDLKLVPSVRRHG